MVMLIIAAQSLSELPFIACYKPEFYTILGLKNTKEKYMKVISFSGSKLIKRIGWEGMKWNNFTFVKVELWFSWYTYDVGGFI